uniref:Uncharacterized protein n=1 Tax=Anguilla anguilla TaxID=7936 RepID=A0A0E9RU08_ANGAN
MSCVGSLSCFSTVKSSGYPCNPWLLLVALMQM